MISNLFFLLQAAGYRLLAASFASFFLTVIAA